MNMRSIYANPYKYACKCDIPIELAKIACLKQRHFIKEQQKHPMYCPICKSKNMNFESGSYEEGYGDFIECEDCGGKASIDNAIEKFADAINLKGLTRLQISKSIEKFPMNILKAPEWYFITEDKSEVKETVLTASISKPISEIDNCKQLSVFDLMGI